MPSMRAIVVKRFGGPDVLEIHDVPRPAPGPGTVRIRVRAFGINRADLLQRRGLYAAPPGVPSDIPGLEYAGEVDALGPGVNSVAIGDRVMGIVGGGAYAEYVISPADHTVAIPRDMSFLEAAAIPEVFITAHDALERLHVEAEEWVLVHAVGSGVGTAALQLIEQRGAHSIGTSRTSRKLERAAALGMVHGIDTSTTDFVEAVRRITGEGANAAIDLVGGSSFAATLDTLASRGRLVLVGITAGPKADVDLAVILRRRLSIEGTVLRSRETDEKSRVVQSFREVVLPLLTTNRIGPIVDRVFQFDEMSEAHEYMESNANFGKIVVEMT